MLKIRRPRKKRQRIQDTIVSKELSFRHNSGSDSDEQHDASSENSSHSDTEQIDELDNNNAHVFDDSDSDDSITLVQSEPVYHIEHVQISTTQFFDSIANTDIQSLFSNTNKQTAVFLTALAIAKQRYNLSNNSISFVLRAIKFLNNNNNMPLDWKNIINKLTILTPHAFSGCDFCGRYIFVKDDMICQVCRKERTERIVHYVPVMKWLKFLFAYSPHFVSHLTSIPGT